MTSDIPDTQRAWINVRRGIPAEALVDKKDWPVPKKLAPGEVLVKVHAAALNPVGYKLMKLVPNAMSNRPRVAEYDLSGVVVDANGTRFKNGDHVFGWVASTESRKTDQGALSEYSKVSEDWIVNCPPNITPTQSAGLTLTGLTAYQAIIGSCNIQPGQRIFINGGTTSVGIFAIQLAKIRGAHVTVAASGGKEDLVRSLGVDEFVNYTKVSVTDYLTEHGKEKKYDFILEAVGLADPYLYSQSNSYLSPNGAYLTVGPQPRQFSEIWKIGKTIALSFWPAFLGGVKAHIRVPLVTPRREDLEHFREYVAEGSVKPVVDSVFSFDDTLKAYDRLMTGRVVGKVVIKIDPTVE